jgi:hypothetical protein
VSRSTVHIEDLVAAGDFCSVPDFGAVMGIGRAAAYRAAAAGDIPAIRIGNQLRCPIARLIQMIEGA